jgi:hypothetical protein
MNRKLKNGDERRSKEKNIRQKGNEDEEIKKMKGKSIKIEGG